jgi:hypothetical protein
MAKKPKVVAAVEAESAPIPKVKSGGFTQEDMSKAVNEALAQALPVAAGVAAKAMMDAMKPPVDAASTIDPREKCGECFQLRRACKGQHEMLVVFPKDEQYGRFFTGVKINGHNYLSNGPGHKICVPLQNNIAHIVESFENNERIQANGRTKNHNSGVLGGPNSQVNHANYPGFR